MCRKSYGNGLLTRNYRKYIPSPVDIGLAKGLKDGQEVERKIDVKEPFSAIVFKTIVDPFVGNFHYLK